MPASNLLIKLQNLLFEELQRNEVKSEENIKNHQSSSTKNIKDQL